MPPKPRAERPRPSTPGAATALQDRQFKELVETVKLRIPIEDAVRERVGELRRAGALFAACCPFHDERTPSFKVDPRRGTWHCYGACGTGGDVISFVQRFDGVEFAEALELLAARAGVELPQGWRGARGRDDGRFAALHGALATAEGVYARALRGPDGARAREYLRERGIADAIVEAFGLGWAPERRSVLAEHAGREGRAAVEVFAAAGLVRRGEGRLYDFFRGRLMIPIRDEQGRTVGFGGRVLVSAPDSPKYVNTPETPVFHKGRLVYGLDKAMDAVRRARHVFLVEGYTDVMAAHQAGLRQVVAVLGTSTTEEHAALLRRTGARRITLVFDGDEAGRRASLRALAGLLPLPVEIDVVRLPGGKDPCDLLVERGAAGLEDLMPGALPWLEFAAEGLVGLAGAALSDGVDEVLRLVQGLATPVMRESALARLSEVLALPAESLRQQARRLGRRATPQRTQEAPRPRPEAPSAPATPSQRLALDAYRDLAGAVLLDNSLIPAVSGSFEGCPDASIAEVLAAVIELYEDAQDEDPIDGVRVMTALGASPARELVVPLEVRARAGESPRQLAEGAVRRLAELADEREFARLKEVHANAADERARLEAMSAMWKAKVRSAGASARKAHNQR